MKQKICFAALIVASFAPALSYAKAGVDPGIGTWKLNLEESIPPQGRKFHPYTVVTRSMDPFLDFTYHGVDGQGNKVEFSYEAPPDGKIRDLPGIKGLKGSMTRLPSGVIDSKIWMPDGTYENKLCVMGITLRKQTCFATITSPNGDVVFFKQVSDKHN